MWLRTTPYEAINIDNGVFLTVQEGDLLEYKDSFLGKRPEWKKSGVWYVMLKTDKRALHLREGTEGECILFLDFLIREIENEKILVDLKGR